jgi:type II secretory pathway component PulC
MNKLGLSGLVIILALLPCAADAQSPPANETGRSFALPPLEELRATRERPLFSPSRQPDATPDTATETPVVEESPDALPFELTGVVMGADMSVAILRNRDTQETVHLRQGETVEAWSIEEIAQRHVVLRQDERQVTLELFAVKPEGAGDAAPPEPSPPVNRPNFNRMMDPSQMRRNSRQLLERQSQYQSQRRPARRGNQPRRPQNDDFSGANGR